MSKRLVKCAKEFHMGTTAIVKLLKKGGFDIDNKPTAKITDEMYNYLLNELNINFNSDSNNEKYYRIWKPIGNLNKWINLDTSILDDILGSWKSRRRSLFENSFEYHEFVEELKREHAIETGIIENLYTLDKGITSTLIKEGFYGSQLSHKEGNSPSAELMAVLKDQFEAVDFVFDIVKKNRNISISFIKELHQLITRNQHYTEGIDQFGNKVRLNLIKGEFKRLDNNPTRPDGVKLLYCPPEHVNSEMDQLIALYETLDKEQMHPLIIAAWFHHSFTTIHPFQDGNGRIARLLASLIFIKKGLFPFTVLREEAKEEYLAALENADRDMPQDLVSYFARVQKRNIQKALNIKDVKSDSLEELELLLQQRLILHNDKKNERKKKIMSKKRNELFEFCRQYLEIYTERFKELITASTSGKGHVQLKANSFEELDKQHYYHKQIIKYAKRHKYFFNWSLPRAWIAIDVEISDNQRYKIGISIHHHGYDEYTIAIGSFLEYKSGEFDDIESATVALSCKPHIISIGDDISPRVKNIKKYLEAVITISIAQITSEIPN